ncbi:hypothetical protein B0H10DRAFT_1661581, partial [Mycena sp. CBHHK59/15]
MRGVPVEFTDWMVRRYEGRTSRIVFDDYTSDPIPVNGGLDQGDSPSGIFYLIYNSDLASIPQPRKGEHGVIFVDDDTLIATGKNVRITHDKIKSMIQRTEGVDDWADDHNTLFGPAKYQL